MKKVVLLFCLFISIQGSLFAQLEYEFKLDEGGLVYFDKVIEVDATKNDLFIRAYDWILKKGWVKDDIKKEGFWMEMEKRDRGDLVLEFEDKEEGIINARGRTNTLIYSNMGIKKNGGTLKYRLTLQFKDNKSKILIDDLYFQKGEMVGVNSGAKLNEDYPEVFGKMGKSQIKKQWENMRKQAIEEFEAIISEYSEAINKKKKTDW